ncbi:response regulator [Clostridia bacterium OttesenSCG-928-O13]|nr:response regulator [Clostridia bacterium OttesenSCG-928-O13]
MNFLLVDDEPGALEQLAGAVQKAEPAAAVHRFDRPSQALLCATDEKMDVAFLDIEMGGMSGLELAKKLKDICGKTNIVFVTAFGGFALDAYSMHASGYILKPATKESVREALENLRHPLAKTTKDGLRVHTFGNFEVYCDDKPLHFSRSKAKELLAYLVHKRGTGCSAKEIASVLYEDRAYTLSVQRQLQTVIHTLLKTMKEAGCGDMIVRTYNNISIDTSKIDCDYYRFIEGDAKAVNGYAGEYMANYSWAEFTAGYLFARGE